MLYIRANYDRQGWKTVQEFEDGYNTPERVRFLENLFNHPWRFEAVTYHDKAWLDLKDEPREKLARFLFKKDLKWLIEPISERSGGFGDAAHYRITLVSTRTWSIEYSMGWGCFDVDKLVKAAKRAANVWDHDAKDMAGYIRRGTRLTAAGAASADLIKHTVKQMYQPEIVDVVCSLLTDAQGSDQDFKDWAGDLGYDDDSIKALNGWEACNDIRRNLNATFTPEELEFMHEQANEM